MRGDKCKFSHDLATIVQFNSKEKGERAGCRALTQADAQRIIRCGCARVVCTANPGSPGLPLL